MPSFHSYQVLLDANVQKILKSTHTTAYARIQRAMEYGKLTDHAIRVLRSQDLKYDHGVCPCGLSALKMFLDFL